jgi:hypothetical protein
MVGAGGHLCVLGVAQGAFLGLIASGLTIAAIRARAAA